jgi:hypothetical protein
VCVCVCACVCTRTWCVCVRMSLNQRTLKITHSGGPSQNQVWLAFHIITTVCKRADMYVLCMHGVHVIPELQNSNIIIRFIQRVCEGAHIIRVIA